MSGISHASPNCAWAIDVARERRLAVNPSWVLTNIAERASRCEGVWDSDAAITTLQGDTRLSRRAVQMAIKEIPDDLLKVTLIGTRYVFKLLRVQSPIDAHDAQGMQEVHPPPVQEVHPIPLSKTLPLGDIGDIGGKPARTKRARPRTPIDPEWRPSPAGIKYAKDRGIQPPVAYAFRNHHLALGNLMANWDAAWCKWCDNEVSWGRAPGKSETLRAANGNGHDRSMAGAP